MAIFQCYLSKRLEVRIDIKHDSLVTKGAVVLQTCRLVVIYVEGSKAEV